MRMKKKLALVLSAALMVASINLMPLDVLAATANGDKDNPAKASTKLTLVVGGANTNPSNNDNNNDEHDNNNNSSESQTQRDENEERADLEETFTFSPVSKDGFGYDAVNHAEVPATAYNLSRAYTFRGVIKGIQTAATAARNNNAGKAEIYSSYPICFNADILNAIRDGGVSVEYYFVHLGHVYAITIPATVDAQAVLNQYRFAGPLYVGARHGTARLVK